MALLTHSQPAALRATLDDIIRTHGRWRVLLALLARRRVPPGPLGLNDHLRRDIGLPPFSLPEDWMR